MADVVRIADVLAGKVAVGTRVTVQGWVRTRRDSKAGLSFVQVHDGTCFDPIQVVVPGDLSNYHDEVVRLSAGCAVECTGELVESQGKGQSVEIKADTLKVIGWVEGFKAVTDVFCPMQGVFAGTNPDLEGDITLMQSAPYDRGWLFQVRGPIEPPPEVAVVAINVNDGRPVAVGLEVGHGRRCRLASPATKFPRACHAGRLHHTSSRSRVGYLG